MSLITSLLLHWRLNVSPVGYQVEVRRNSHSVECSLLDRRIGRATHVAVLQNCVALMSDFRLGYSSPRSSN